MSERWLVVILCVLFFDSIDRTVALQPTESFVKNNYTRIFGKSAIRRLIEGTGFGFENYTIYTEDGYQLNLNRMVNRKVKGPNRGYPLLLVNGYFMQSEAWLVNPRADTNIAAVWAARGYDVWLGDQRGTMRSRGHRNYTVKDEKFWDFSFHESGVYDIAAFVDFILQKTGHKNLIFSCMSLGCSFHAILLSERPSYNEKIRGAVYFVPLVNNIRKIEEMNIYMNFWFRTTISSMNYIEKAKMIDFFPDLGKMRKEMYYLCLPGRFWSNIVLRLLYGTTIHFHTDSLCSIAALSVGGSNLKSSKHVAQVYESGDFANFNYGREENKRRYGQEIPPLYNMSKITSFVAIYYSDHDDFAGPEGVEKTRKSLGGPTYLCQMPDFNHLDVAGGMTFRYVLPDATAIVDALSGVKNDTEKLQSGKCPSFEWIRHLRS